MKKSIYLSVIALFLLIAIISGMMIYAHFKEANTQEELYESLAEIVEHNETETEPTEPSENTEPVILPEYAELYEQNGDIVGWITIPATKINYPVMQSPDNPNFYLKHGFDKGYTDYGCPYVSEECDVNKPSDNLIIYGHNMKNGSMFSALNQFKSKDFWEKHRTVYFNTLYEKQTYEIVAVFKTVVYTDSADEFRYYRFVDAKTPEPFDEYISEVKARAFYDTGVFAKYGDKLITLSTCEYSNKKRTARIGGEKSDGRRIKMADIKTRDVVKGTIKTIDKAAVAGDRMKRAYISTKERAENSTYAVENSADEYASDKVERGVDTAVHEGVHQFDKVGRKGLKETKENVRKAKDGIDRFKEKRAEQSLKKQTQNVGNKTIKTAEKSVEKTVKQSATSVGKKTIKTVGKGTGKAATKTVKTAEQTAKTAIKTTQQAAKAAQKTTQASAKAAQKAAQTAKATAKAAATAVKVAVKATVAAVKAIIAGTKVLIAAIAAGGWVAVVIIIVICLIALICGSVFGIFFSGENSGTGQTMQTAVQEINADYDNRLNEIKNGNTYEE